MHQCDPRGQSTSWTKIIGTKSKCLLNIDVDNNITILPFVRIHQKLSVQCANYNVQCIVECAVYTVKCDVVMLEANKKLAGVKVAIRKAGVPPSASQPLELSYITGLFSDSRGSRVSLS